MGGGRHWYVVVCIWVAGLCVDAEGSLFWVFVELWVVVFVSGGSGWAEPEDCGWSGGSGEVGGWHVLQAVFAMPEKDV